MRVLRLVTNGHSKFFRQQVTGLRERGHDLDVLSVPGDSVVDGRQTDRRPASAYVRFYVNAVATARDDYDLVHASYGLTAPPAVVQPFHPVILSLWGSDLLGGLGPITRQWARFADEVVVMSEEMADELSRDTHLIPHGVDLSKFRPQSQTEARTELGWDPGARHVLFPYGPSRDVKDYPRAERIVDEVRSRIDGPVRLQTVTGATHDQMPLYMNAADAMLLTSKSEGCPNSVKEALACNLPVVAVDVGDVARLLDGVSPSVVDSDDDVLADALATTLNAPERSNGREAVSSISLSNQLDRIEALYEANAS